MEQVDILKACLTLVNAPEKGSREAQRALDVLVVATRRGQFQATLRELAQATPCRN